VELNCCNMPAKHNNVEIINKYYAAGRHPSHTGASSRHRAVNRAQADTIVRARRDVRSRDTGLARRRMRRRSAGFANRRPGIRAAFLRGGVHGITAAGGRLRFLGSGGEYIRCGDPARRPPRGFAARGAARRASGRPLRSGGSCGGFASGLFRAFGAHPFRREGGTCPRPSRTSVIILKNLSILCCSTHYRLTVCVCQHYIRILCVDKHNSP